MVVFIDFGLVAVLAILFGGLIAGTFMSVAEWMLSHISLLIVVMFVKALACLALTGVFKRNSIQGIFCILINMVRSTILIWAFVDGILTGFSGGLFKFISTAFGFIIGFPIFIIAYSIAVFFEDEPILGEIISVALMALCCLILYGVFGGW